MTETKLDPKQFSRTLNFYISDSENGISRVPRDKLVEIQQYIADLDDPKASAAEPVAWQQRERRIGGSEWSNWYPSFKEAYDDFRAGFRSGGKFDYEVRALVPVATPPASASAGEVMVKALEWAGNMASTPFGSYTVCENSDDKWEFTYHSYPYGIADEATFDTEGEAKAASQADFDRRIRSALTAPPATPAVSQGCHPSHKTRMSDASSYDEICVNCGATDTTGGWGALAKPCPATPAVAAARLSIKEWVEETIKNPDKARENLQEIAAMYLADIAVATPAVEITDDMVERLDSVSPDESIGVFGGSGQWIEVCTVAEFRALKAALGGR